ncbi:MAG: hypothetical protein ACRDIB_01135 [Ardenticatenaceae bacterium]
MRTNRLLRTFLLSTVLLIGAWLLWRPTHLTPETTLAREARAQNAAPGRPTDWQGGIPEGLIDLGNGAYRYEPISPVVVNLADIPEGVSMDNGLYARWQRGEIDLEENEGGLTQAEVEALQEAARALPPSAAADNARSGAGERGPEPAGTAFDSMDYTESGGWVPPDPEMAAGPNHLIATVNVAFEIYDKQGASLIGPTDFTLFFAQLGGGCVAFSFDPNVLYDEEHDRFMMATDGNGAEYCIGVSQTGDPTGAWNLYSFNTNVGGLFFDYPHAGIGDEAIYLGANMFGSGTGRIWAFEKEAMYNGQAASAVTRPTIGSDHTPQPLRYHGYALGDWPSGPHYFMTGQSFNSAANYSLYEWQDPFGANVLTRVNTFNLPAIHGVAVGYPVASQQAGGGGSITANDPRPLDFEYRDGSGWTVMSVSCNPGSGTVNCVQWAEVDLASASVVQTGVYASNGNYRWMADVSTDSCGNAAIGYTRSSTSIFPSVWVTGRETTDPLGDLQSEVEMKAGEITYTAFDSPPRRWGDYTGMTIDPDGTTFWYLGQYSKDTGTIEARWGNYIGSFRYASCEGGAAASVDFQYRLNNGDTGSRSATLNADGTFTDNLGDGGSWTFDTATDRLRLAYNNGDFCRALMVGAVQADDSVRGGLLCRDGSGIRGGWAGTTEGLQ